MVSATCICRSTRGEQYGILTNSSVVFSTWRLTLGIVEAGLNQASIQNIRFDGKVPQKERQRVVGRFRTDPNVRVMLLTLSCGAVGWVISPLANLVS